MKKLFPFIAILILLSSWGFAAPAESLSAENTTDTTAVAGIESPAASYAEISKISSLPALFDYLNRLISWKHWRYWVALVGTILLWLIFTILYGTSQDLFSQATKEKLIKREGNYYLFWVGYSFVIALFFTFGYEHVVSFFSKSELLWALPENAHWTHWVLWSGLALLSAGAIWAFFREIVVFKLMALYTIPYQILHGAIAMLAMFFFTTAVTYFIAGIGIIVGTIIVVVLGLAILFFVLQTAGEAASNVASGGSGSQHTDNSSQKRSNEAYKREKERLEKFNRKSLEETRGW